MEVVIAGAGSIGLLMGSYFAEAGWKVSFYTRREEQASIIRKEGIKRIDAEGTECIFQVNAETEIEKLPKSAPWIVAVKYSGVASIISILEERKMDNAVMFIQNGLGHFNLVEESELPTVFFATVEHGAGRLNDRTVSHNGIGFIRIAPFRGDENVFDPLRFVNTSAFPIEFVEDARGIVLRKVLINCMINPLTAILQLRNGELLERKHAKILFDELFLEISNAFPEMQESLPKDAIEEVCRKTALNQSSMLKDRLNGNSMEIETIVTAVIKMAEKKGTPLPILKTLEKILFVLDGR
ncbi:2-dehydropantoate 2-reductase [Sporosarcina thermotolerans]|uniref:2-dehydropantoate 2-reductase n=1 Tax=Sporosarcina thermotolerans TaxID=633404 RepID=A0AAW9A484_9BACL|nr:2-dehydropantoate 2-reductase [Sporosarcina thermotolerans]MDW0115827.1 2-dehydropantoate 2-reductase [Sporosarcina thermotolerans]